MRALVRFRISSPNHENGFVSLAVRFVEDPARSNFTGLRVEPVGFALAILLGFSLLSSEVKNGD
jgi:hypothetical protein